MWQIMQSLMIASVSTILVGLYRKDTGLAPVLRHGVMMNGARYIYALLMMIHNNLHFYSVKLMIGTKRGHSSEMLTVIVKIHLP